MVRVTVLNGGTSDEREVSLRSGAAVASALKASGYKVTVLDPKSADITEIIDCDIVFPVLHGAGGEDGAIQSQLEKRGIPFVGSGSKASALCFDKWEYRKVITAAGLPMPRGDTLEHHEHATHHLAQDLHVLKPIAGGSSIDTFIVRDLKKIPHDAIAEAFARYSSMLIEELIDGTELTVGILGDKALPIIEIVPPEGGEYDYTNKYFGDTKLLVAPERIDSKIQSAAQELALQAHRLTGCRDLSRSDIMCDKTGKLFLLETNTIPGMTGHSLFPKMAANIGLDMPALCSRLVEMAL
ncbi:MAG TPA: D-alanine--D-alanine ligase [Candidatus Saccharimonadales bacterium]